MSSNLEDGSAEWMINNSLPTSEEFLTASQDIASSANILKPTPAIDGNANVVIETVENSTVSITYIFTEGEQKVACYSGQSTQNRVVQLGENPYKSLETFQEGDAQRFFGRDQQIKHLWRTLRDLHQSPRAIRFLIVYGPSGSGKSSLVRAGLIPELARKPLPECDQVRIVLMVPGPSPLESLAKALARVAVGAGCSAERLSQEFETILRRDVGQKKVQGLQQIAQRIPSDDQTPLIILVDQFEEIYSQCKSRDEQKAFIENLIWSSGNRSKKISVVATLRSDFLGETQNHATLNRLISSKQGVLVRVMEDHELQEAICGPVAHQDGVFEPETVSRLIRETREREGALPLLQFALHQIWESLPELPGKTLESIGGVGGAISKRAEDIYDCLNDSQQAIAKRMFKSLVQLGEGTRDTRRRVRLDELIGHQEDPNEISVVVNKFAAPSARLITLTNQTITAPNDESDSARSYSHPQSDEALQKTVCIDDTQIEQVTNLSISREFTIAEITHEALLDHWPVLRKWINDSREDLRFNRKLADAVEEWREKSRPKGLLWQSLKLDELKTYYQKSGHEMTSLQISFFEACKVMEQNQKIKIRQEQEFKQWSARGLAALLVTVVGFAGFALLENQAKRTERAEKEVYQFKESASVDEILPESVKEFVQYLSILLENAKQYEEQENSEKALETYRIVKQKADEIQIRINSNQDQYSIALDYIRKLERLSETSGSSIVEIVMLKKISNLEYRLIQDSEAGNFLKLKNNDFTRRQNQFDEGALKETYKIILTNAGIKADINNDGRITSELEVKQLPCELLRKIQRLWREHTQEKCDFYGENFYENSKCSALEYKTLSHYLFFQPAKQSIINRFKECKVLPTETQPRY